MSHIFGIAHTLDGILDQVTGIFGGGTTSTTPGFGPGGMTGGSGVVDDTFGSGAGTVGAGGLVITGPSCPGKVVKRFITTVNADGTTTTRPAKSRRRKRRLASVSDIKDLAALKSVLGGGKAFESWIATRGR